MTKVLIENGADINAKNHAGDTPVDIFLTMGKRYTYIVDT